MNYKKYLGALLMTATILGSACSGGKKGAEAEDANNQFVTVKDGEFHIGDSVYRYVGTNFC